MSDEGQMQRFDEIRNQVLERVKGLLSNSPGHGRRHSISSYTSSGKKRDWNDSDDEDISEHFSNTKPRVLSPVKTS